MKNFIYSNIAASILVISSPVYAQPKTPTTEPQKSETVIKNSKDICVAMINGQATLTGQDARASTGSLANGRQKAYDDAIERILKQPICKIALGIAS